MDDFKTQLEELAGQVDNITVVKKIVTNEDIEKLERRLNKRIDDLKKDMILYFGLIGIFIGTIVTLIVKFV